MRPSRLRALGLPVRIGLASGLAVLLTGWAVSLHLTARTGPGALWDSLSPEATRLRACAPPLERAIETHMRRHIPRAAERRALVRWMRHGARMNDYFGEPSRIIARRCGGCHGEGAQAGIRLQTYADAFSLATPSGRDPYRRLQRLHVHLFTIGLVLCLLALGLALSRYPKWLALTVGLLPVGALLASAPLSLWCFGAPGLLWLCDALVVGAWPLGIGLLAWDLFAPASPIP